jgi:class 3 adenylate cyclase/tetratricopeptide (TPR) repeat protein
MTLAEHQDLGRRAQAAGESLIAFDIADEGLKRWASDAELHRIKALALARMGSHAEAQEILTHLRNENPNDIETLGLLARTQKDLWLETESPEALEQAYGAYAEAFAHVPESYWTGINAATLAHARGDGNAAKKTASEVKRFCVAAGEASYWTVATLGEAALVLGDIAEAESRYAEAARLASGDFGNLVSTWRNAKILLRAAPPDVRARIERAFRLPVVAVFTGHRTDQPGRTAPRFPEHVAPAVKQAIAERLRKIDARLGYSSAASGSDILFLEAMHEAGGRTHIVLPCNVDQFASESVAPAWRARFEAALGRATEVTLASEQRLRFGSVAYEYASELLDGLATVRAHNLETNVVRMAVWDGRPGDGPGGSADIVARWRGGGHPVELINPLDLAGKESPPPSLQAVSPLAPESASGVRAMLFADAYHFSRLSEDQMPAFIDHFMGAVADLVEASSPAPQYQNTWGDGLFFVFDSLADAGSFALRLSERVAAIDRAAAKLPEGLNLRIALHAGPVYRFSDRIIGRLNYIGTHVNRAARIEPVTPPGKVYASEAFAGLAALRHPGAFRFRYVGRIPLAKSFGEFPMYEVLAKRRR